jgi:hypothetical protein
MSYFTKDQIAKDGGIIYDPSENPALSPKDLPDTSKILDQVYLILEYMCKDDIIKLKQSDQNEYNNALEAQFPEFSKRYFSVFSQVISGNDLTNLFMMLSQIDKVKNGQTSLEEVEKKIGKDLSKQYYKTK